MKFSFNYSTFSCFHVFLTIISFFALLLDLSISITSFFFLFYVKTTTFKPLSSQNLCAKDIIFICLYNSLVTGPKILFPRFTFVSTRTALLSNLTWNLISMDTFFNLTTTALCTDPCFTFE